MSGWPQDAQTGLVIKWVRFRLVLLV